MRKHFSLIAAAIVFAALVICSQSAAEGAREGLRLCAESLVPSLFPFFVMARLLSSLGLPDLLAGRLGDGISRLFRISGAGVQAFFLGITGGYPLGAAVTADLRREGRIGREEAERLLAFCNNSGPGFILGTAAGVFQSPAAGILLYVTHVLAAVCVGFLFRGQTAEPAPPPSPIRSVPPGEAVADATAGAISSVLNVCAYVILFRALLAMLPPLPLSPAAAAAAAGFFELSSGMAVFAGQAPTPAALASAALILGWGGLSVHAQTLGVLRGTDIKCARHLLGRALCGVLAAVLIYLSASMLM